MNQEEEFFAARIKTNWHDRYDSSEAEGDVASEDDDEEVAAKPAGE